MTKQGRLLLQYLITGIVWSVLYFSIFVPIVSIIFSFDFLSFSTWAKKWEDFLEYRWQIKTGFDFLLLLAMFLWIPLWALVWWGLCQIDISGLFPTKKPKAVVQDVLKNKNLTKQTYAAPRPMPSTIQVKKYVAPRLPGQEEHKIVQGGEKSHTNVLQMIKAMAVVARKYKVEIFQHILLEGNRVPMAISTDARAVLIEIVNRKNVNWSVEFTDDVTKSGWYSESGTMENLALELIGATNSLAKSEPNSEILSAIVLTDGRIVNAKETEKYFKKHGIFLLSFNNGEPKSDLLDIASFLSAYFDLKDGETDPALKKLPKVPLPQRNGTTPQQNTPSDNTEQTSTNNEELPVEDELPVDDELPTPNPSPKERTVSHNEDDEIYDPMPDDLK